MIDTSQFLTGFGGLAVFAVVFADQAGLPIPAPPFLLAAGALAASGKLDGTLAVGMTALAATLADSLWFCLGRKSSAGALRVLSRWSLSRHHSFGQAKKVMEQHGFWALAVAKFLPGTIMPSIAGALGMSVRRFLLFDSLASILYAACYLTAGYIFHDEVQQAMVWFNRVGHGVIGLGVLLVIIYLGYKYAMRYGNRRLKKKAKSTDTAGRIYPAIASLKVAAKE